MRFIKIGAVIVGAIIITALSIDAADTLQGKSGTLLSQVIQTTPVGACPVGMTELVSETSIKCIDTYEVAPKSTCPHGAPASVVETQDNLGNAACGGESLPDKKPWTFITREQALQICARAGKRLPTAAEWYSASLGHIESDASCNVSSGELRTTGTSPSCTSAVGAHDMIGNVWEWVSDDIINGSYNQRALPESGYVGQVDSGGIATVSTDTGQILFEDDYFWSKNEGAFGIIRGGFYGSGKDAGIYSVHADTLPTAAGTAIGFRCVL